MATLSKNNPSPHHNYLKVPVLLIAFNRPETTQKVIDAIQQANPSRLYVAIDGPRPGNGEDIARIEQVKQVISAIAWNCEVNSMYQAENLGCKRAVISAITWFFRHEEEGIILEDDCLPHRDFFGFCEILLERYRDNSKIWAISGDNFQDGHWRGDSSYYFSHYNHVWGWASWRRAWHHYDGDLTFWPRWKNSEAWRHKELERVERTYWANIFDQMYTQQIDTWDYPWVATVWYHDGLTIIPNVNLVSNIGITWRATHTKLSQSRYAVMPTYPLPKLIHPSEIVRNKVADTYTFNHVYRGIQRRILYWLLHWLSMVVILTRRLIAQVNRGKTFR